MPQRNVVDGFVQRARMAPETAAFRELDGRTVGWGEYLDAAARFAGGLRGLGVRPGDRVVLMLRNRLEFHIADTGALLAGATPISIYNSSSPEQITYLASHCRASLVVTETGDFVDRVQSADLPTVRGLVVVDADERGVTPYSDLLSADAVDVDASAADVDPTDLLTVIYTSGTTGPPKGVMIDHTNVLAACVGLRHYLGDDGSRHRVVSYLPMAHIAERMVSHYNHLLWGPTVTPCADMAQLGAALVAVRPTLLFGPPRVWEKLAAGIRAAVDAQPKHEQERFLAATAVGRQVQQTLARGADLDAALVEKWADVDAQLLHPLRAMVGLDQCEVAFSGAAPIPPEVIEFLRDLGVPMSEIYGMSENTGGMTWEPTLVKVGKVGRAYPDTEVITAPDGEVLCRGAIVFKGYLDDPERTRETLDDDGWLHTGDIGEFDDDGYLRIVDRKKELIITAGGKNVSPANIEAALKTIPLVGQAMAIGDARPYLVGILTLDPDAARSGHPDRSLDEIAADADVVAEVAAGVAAVNARLSRVEHVRRFVLLGEEWLPDSDVLTPTMKLKRRGVLGRYADLVEQMYAGGGVEVEPAREMEPAP